MGELHSASTIATNSTSVLPNNTAGRRKKSLGKIYNFIEPNAPNSGLNYIINSIKGNSTSHAQQQTITTTNTSSNNINHPTKHSLSNKTSNPLIATGLASSNVKGNRFTNLDSNRHTNSSLGKYSFYRIYMSFISHMPSYA